MSSDAWSNLDKVDQKIIEILNKNARTPSKEIATELRKSGHDVSDRTIRKRIERLEKSGIIKGYKAVLSDVSETNEYEALFIKFKPTKSLESVKESIKEHVIEKPNYLLVANLEGEWNRSIKKKRKPSTCWTLWRFYRLIISNNSSKITYNSGCVYWKLQ